MAKNIHPQVPIQRANPRSSDGSAATRSEVGRRVKLTPEQIDHARKLIDQGEARQYVADLLSVGRSTLYRALAGTAYLRQWTSAPGNAAPRHLGHRGPGDSEF